jgi:hypothetical protein
VNNCIPLNSKICGLVCIYLKKLLPCSSFLTRFWIRIELIADPNKAFHLIADPNLGSRLALTRKVDFCISSFFIVLSKEMESLVGRRSLFAGLKAWLRR